MSYCRRDQSNCGPSVAHRSLRSSCSAVGPGPSALQHSAKEGADAPLLRPPLPASSAAPPPPGPSMPLAPPVPSFNASSNASEELLPQLPSWLLRPLPPWLLRPLPSWLQRPLPLPQPAPPIAPVQPSPGRPGARRGRDMFAAHARRRACGVSEGPPRDGAKVRVVVGAGGRLWVVVEGGAQELALLRGRHRGGQEHQAWRERGRARGVRKRHRYGGLASIGPNRLRLPLCSVAAMEAPPSSIARIAQQGLVLCESLPSGEQQQQQGHLTTREPSLIRTNQAEAGAKQWSDQAPCSPWGSGPATAAATLPRPAPAGRRGTKVHLEAPQPAAVRRGGDPGLCLSPRRLRHWRAALLKGVDVHPAHLGVHGRLQQHIVAGRDRHIVDHAVAGHAVPQAQPPASGPPLLRANSASGGAGHVSCVSCCSAAGRSSAPALATTRDDQNTRRPVVLHSLGCAHSASPPGAVKAGGSVEFAPKLRCTRPNASSTAGEPSDSGSPGARAPSSVSGPRSRRTMNGLYLTLTRVFRLPAEAAAAAASAATSAAAAAAEAADT
ncbi:hypothetical protein TSOC_007350 [Tetrabaena socialis]|uniref:Uncharacterized protein n=1 Tax=Tetrabaena socialis TaxID=47790 RepID=A0A2J8A195_9CHLO|nr:hypothetical protein TSOC_007350 [Tetrabaena socialis]|eukprot:PNH06296.1 hypothetical protein TSOC_007350 [Tetrabaena socialis]